jgi:hypothetical protein
VYTHLQIDLKILYLAPLAPQLWGEPEVQSPPELGDLGGEKHLCVHRSLSKGREQENSDSPENKTPCIPPLIRGVRGVISGTVARRFLTHLALRQKQFQRER